jgi:hypothetical protein
VHALGGDTKGCICFDNAEFIPEIKGTGGVTSLQEGWMGKVWFI